MLCEGQRLDEGQSQIISIHWRGLWPRNKHSTKMKINTRSFVNFSNVYVEYFQCLCGIFLMLTGKGV